MNDRMTLLLAGGLLAAALVPPCASADEKPAGARVGKCQLVAGALLQRRQADAPWQPVKVGDAVRAESLLVALPEAEVKSLNGRVVLVQLADVGQRGPFPVLESAVRLHDNPKVDLDFTLERGIAGVVNVREKGPAHVRFRFQGQSWDVKLLDPGTRVWMELYGRHPPGTPQFFRPGAPKEEPTLALYLLVLAGRASLLTGTQEIGLSAPPGPALVYWNSVDGKVTASHKDKLPESIRPTKPEEVAQYKEGCAIIKRLNEEPLDKVLGEFLKSDNALERRVGVVSLGALDKVPQLIDALSDARHPDVRDRSIVVMRGWIGRGPGQVEKFYEALTKRKDLSPVQAQTIIQLLYGFTDEERQDPATYDLLLEYLRHAKLPIRELARWHLVRLAPAGKKIAFDAAAPADQRDRAYRQWRALIPAGQLPPPATPAPAGKQ